MGSNFATPASIHVTGTGVVGQAVNTPTVTSVSPNSGPAAGGTKVTITGTNLTQVTGIAFGANQATSFSCPSSTTCTAVSPAGFSTVHVHVTNSAGTSPKNGADHFAYQ